MNRTQVLFVLSFLFTFSSLLAFTYFLKQKLGLDLSRLILIGIDDQHPLPTPAMSINSSYVQYVALALALATGAFFYVKSNAKRAPVLNPKEFQLFSLKEKIVVSPNTAIYRIALPRPDDVLGLPIGQHISISAQIDGKDVIRSYTPTSSDDDLGHFDLLIKSYEKGNISRYVSFLKIGDKIKVRGPKGAFKYSPTLSRHIGMIAGGTGITPMLQIIRAALKNPADKTKLSLIYANVSFDDILLKKELDDLAAKHPQRFTIYYVLNNPPQNWSGGVGFVSKEQIDKYMPRSSTDAKVLMCGPPPMMNAMKKHLAELDHPAPRAASKLEDQVFLF